MNSLDGKPDAERAAIAAEGPGMGMTGIFSVAHSLACEKRYTMLMSHRFRSSGRLKKQEAGTAH